jgi:spermidine/putrescine transport system ATP-binding protein
MPAYQRKTNMIFQSLALFPHMSIAENVAFGLRRKRVPNDQIKERVRSVLALIRLEGYDDRLPDQLSGGQRQRVAMARAIVNDPSVLLLDEPLGALDLQLRITMQEELRRLHRALKSTFVFVTHDQSEAMTMSDRIAVMNAGLVQQIGTPEEIYENPKNRFVASFIGHANLLDCEVEEVLPNGLAAVDCMGLRLVARAASAAKGEKRTLTLRYERASISVGPVGEPRCSFPCEIAERVYMGSAIRFRVRLEKGLEMIADVAEVDSVRSLEVGDKAYLRVADGVSVAVPN